MAVILIEMEVDELAEGSPAVERVTEVVRAVAETIRHRAVGPGVVVGNVHASLTDAVSL